MYVIFIILYRYNCSLLLIVIVINLLLRLIYKVNFTVGMYRKKHSRHRVQHYLRFQASTGDLETYTPRIRRDYCKTVDDRNSENTHRSLQACLSSVTMLTARGR